MTDLRKAAEMALEALLEANNIALMELSIDDAYSDEITALRQALAQPEQERLSLRLDVGGGIARASAACGDQIESVAQELPKREWVGLSDEEVWDAYEKGMYEEMWFARAIEAKLKEKNNG